MKKIILLMAIAAAGFVNNTTAQTSEPHLDLNVTSNCPCIPDITMVLYAYDLSCNVVGMSNPFAYPSSNTPGLTYSSISSGPGWAPGMDPGAWSGVNNWYFGAADFYNCAGTPSSGGSCGSGFYDFLHLIWGGPSVACGPTANDCFEYGLNCSSCNSGQIVNCHFDGGYHMTGGGGYWINSDSDIMCN